MAHRAELAKAVCYLLEPGTQLITSLKYLSRQLYGLGDRPLVSFRQEKQDQVVVKTKISGNRVS